MARRRETPSATDGPTSPPQLELPDAPPQPDTNWLAGFAIGHVQSQSGHPVDVRELITVADAIAVAARLPTTVVVEHALDMVAQTAAISEDSRTQTESLLRQALELTIARERGDA